MAEELQLRIHTELCKATVESTILVAKQLKISDPEVKDKGKFSIINKIGNVIEEQLTGLADEDKVGFLQPIAEILIDLPPPLEELDDNKSELLILKKEIEALKLMHEQISKEVGVKESITQVKQEQVNLQSGDGVSPFQSLIESTSVLRRQFKIVGQIGDPDQKDKLNYNSLRRQIDTGVEQKYKEHEIVDGVIRAISPGLVLRSYLESFKTLSLERLKKILRRHYGVKNTTELYQSLASICQSGKETPQAFLMRALDLRQKILFASQEGEDSLKYDASHIQQLFRRTVETGLQDESIRVKLRPYLANPLVEDEDLIHQMNVAVSSEEERLRKLKSQTKTKPAYVTQIGQEAESPEVPSSKVPTVKKDPNQPNREKTELQELKAEVEALKTEVKSRSEANAQPVRQGGNSWSYGRGWERREARPRPSKCQSCFEKGEERCNHCFKCGSDSHYAIGCRQGQSPGQRSLNERRLLVRDQK